jgi:hypothetical protein
MRGTKLACVICAFALAPVRAQRAEPGKYDVTFTTPSSDVRGSMPLGNGRMGANIWVEPDGHMYFLMSHVDAVDEDGHLLKTGLVEVEFDDGINISTVFSQTYHVNNGTISVQLGPTLSAQLWVDIECDALHVEVRSSQSANITSKVHVWRNATTPDADASSFCQNTPAHFYPDIAGVTTTAPPAAFVYHWNNVSSARRMPIDLQAQNMPSEVGKLPDHSANKCFGLTLSGSDLRDSSSSSPRTSPYVLRGHASPAFSLLVTSTLVEARSGSHCLDTLMQERERCSKKQQAETADWWRRDWQQSYIDIGGANGFSLSQMNALYRQTFLMMANTSYGIKFNGYGIFAASSPDFDSRPWALCSGFRTFVCHTSTCYMTAITRNTSPSFPSTTKIPTCCVRACETGMATTVFSSQRQVLSLVCTEAAAMDLGANPQARPLPATPTFATTVVRTWSSVG